MKKDIRFYPVQNVMLAIVKQENGFDAVEWKVFVINKNDKKLENVMVTSKGYGESNGQKQETSILRHFLGEIEPGENKLIEPISPQVFHLFNEFWLSYFIEGQVYDKKFVFVPGSISENNLIRIKQLDMDGVLHT